MAPAPGVTGRAGHSEVSGLARPERPGWHALGAAVVVEKVGTSIATGLSVEEARARLQKDGSNRLAEVRRPSLLSRFLAQVSDSTVLALLGAAAIAGTLAFFSAGNGSSFAERYGDSLAILAIVVLNAVLGLVQERRAERALDALRDMTAPTAKVKRGGQVVDVPAADLVVGDVLVLEEGDRVPADVRLVVAHELELGEAALTGESQPVRKDAAAALAGDTPLAERSTMAFMATQVSRGRAQAVVVATGMSTELGSIAGMLAEVQTEETPLEKDLERFGKQVVIGCVVISLLVFAAGMLMSIRHGRDLRVEARELFLVAVALAVAAIPEGLPAITTIVLALGTTRMARRHALVRRLPAVETLGCTQVVCTDKTGTLTQNRMTARRVWIGGAAYDVTPGAITLGITSQVPLITPLVPVAGEAQHGEVALFLRAAAHAIGARSVIRADNTVDTAGDPTDGAVLGLAWKCNVRDHRPVIAERPFTSDRRMASVLVDEDSGPRSYVRGAPEAVLAGSVRMMRGGRVRPLEEAERRQILEEAASWAGRALRVIALALRDGPEAAGEPERGLTFLGLVGLIDPPRPEVKAAIAEAREAGIQTIMITGDHPATARAIATEIGLWGEGDLLLTGAELDGMAQEALAARVDRLRVVARATASHKLRIVDALKARGLVCAMTGDGVNDAPAVKAASIGIAMGKAGTDVTKEAADLVLSDDNYATIVAAVEEGRAIYANIRKFVFFLLSSNAGIVLVVLAASLLGWHSPLAPIQILWINLITNGLPALALGVDLPDPDEMHRPPRAPGGTILSRREYIEIVAVGVIMGVTALAAFHVGLAEAGGSSQDIALPPELLERARTICFAILAVGPLLHAFNCRSKTKSLFALGVFTNRALLGAVAVGLVLEAATIWLPPLRPIFRTVPLDLEALKWVGAMSLAPLVVGELAKVFGLTRGAAG